VREEHRVRVCENRVLKNIFGPKMDEVTREWIRLHKRSFMICTPHQILLMVSKSRGMRWAGHASRMGDRRGTYRVLMLRSDGKRALGRNKCR
jgi:hypothetical protein